MRDIAKRGLKGRKKDTFLLKLVITLAFIFIVASTIFQASTEKTKLEQRLDLYGEWHAAYLGSDRETLDSLISEPEVDRAGVSLIIGESDECGVVGTFNQDLIDMGRFSLYKGRFPEAPNEIMLEMNQMSNMNLDLEVGQKIDVVITLPIIEEDPKEYILQRNKEFYELVDPYRQEYLEAQEELYKEKEELELKLEEENDPVVKAQIQNQIDEISYRQYAIWSGFPRPTSHEHNEQPYDQIGDVSVVVHNNYFYYHMIGEEFTPEIMKKDGLLLNQKVILKKEFIVTGILQTYTDKWDLGGHKSPNAFITEEGGKTFTDAFYGNEIGDFSDYEMDYNVFLYSDSYKEELYDKLSPSYLNMEKPSEEITEAKRDTWFWMNMYGMTDEEIEQALKESSSWEVTKRLEDWRDNSLEGTGDLVNKMEINTNNFRRNTFSYPEITTSTEHILTLAIIAVIFIATALAIFQIFLTQMKRRARKIVLLKSIGATNGQVVKMLFYEGLYLLRTGLIIGVPVGFGIAAAVIYGMNTVEGSGLQFYIMPNLLILGIIAGCLALFVGMAVPMIYAIRIPLVGTMSKPPKHVKIKHKDDKNFKIKRQTFRHINLRYFKLNKGKTLVSFGISFITITIMLTTTLLCYFSFDDYKNSVLANNRPDYAMELYYGEAVRSLSQAKEEIMQIEGVEEADVYKVGMQTFLWYEGIEDNKLLKAYEQLLPDKLLPAHFSKYNAELVRGPSEEENSMTMYSDEYNDELQEQPEWIKNAFYTKIYGVDIESELFTIYNSAITEGAVDKKRFDEGEEVIILVPMYLAKDTNVEGKNFSDELVINATNENNRMGWLFDQSGAYRISYSSRYKDYYSKQNDIKPGDTIYLSADAERIEGESYTVAHNTRKVTVGGLIYYFPKEGVWPFSNNVAPYVVISSTKCMESIYPNSRLGLYQNTLEGMKRAVDTLYPTRYGRTLWYINTDSREPDVILDSKLLAYANNNGYTLYNYKNSSAQLYYEAFNNAIIIGLLGFTAAVISVIILYNTTVSKMEQDRNRIGILQSIGVTKNQFSKHYIQVGIISGILSVLIINILLMAVMLISSIGAAGGINMTFGDYIRDIFQYRLWLYPWPIHVAICIVYFILTVLIYYLPSRNITSQYPVENIRSLSR